MARAKRLRRRALQPRRNSSKQMADKRLASGGLLSELPLSGPAVQINWSTNEFRSRPRKVGGQIQSRRKDPFKPTKDKGSKESCEANSYHLPAWPTSEEPSSNPRAPSSRSGDC